MTYQIKLGRKLSHKITKNYGENQFSNVKIKDFHDNYHLTYDTSSQNNYQVKLDKKSSYKIINDYTITQENIIMPQSLHELDDVEISGTNDKYVLMYDATSGKWKDKNPDEVLSASSTTESSQPGLPNDFIDKLDVDLDDKIDLDAGTF